MMKAKLTELTRISVAAMLAVAMLVGAGVASADEPDSHYRDLYELKQLHVAFHAAVSHAGVDATTKGQHLAERPCTLDGGWCAKAAGCQHVPRQRHTGRGESCAPGSLTLCDFFANHAGSFVLGRDWVSVTPIFTEALSVDDRHEADIYWQCIYLDANNNDLKVSNVTIGLPGLPDTGRAKKVHGHWLFSYVESESIPAPTIDVYE